MQVPALIPPCPAAARLGGRHEAERGPRRPGEKDVSYETLQSAVQLCRRWRVAIVSYETLPEASAGRPVMGECFI